MKVVHICPYLDEDTSLCVSRIFKAAKELLYNNIIENTKALTMHNNINNDVLYLSNN